jgi:Ca2+-binding EF-hand superfamily protein
MKTFKRLGYGAFYAFAFSSGLAHAQQPSPAQMQRAAAQLDARFTAADTNKDGCVTKDEAKDKMPRLYANFEQVDKDKKSCVTLDQVKASFQDGVAEMKAKKQN